MQHTTSVMRKHVCAAALSLALAPLAASAQSQYQAPAQTQAGQASGQSATMNKMQPSQQAATPAAQGTSGASGMSGKSASGQAGAAKSGSAAVPAATFVLVPVVSPLRDQWMRSGCWARLYDNTGFSGDSLTLSGPLDMPDMVGPFGIDWKGKISSIETGPNTTLVVYDNVNYRDPASTFKPGERVGDVSKRMGFFDQMRSLRITCSPVTPAR